MKSKKILVSVGMKQFLFHEYVDYNVIPAELFLVSWFAGDLRDRLRTRILG